ncbi:MAG: hypothetical protein K2P70_19110 [Hyphomonadaceae bacterium]|jgi:hypothetical protein|nr:hypothetical protein [Hyphomonadaceae bacterium]
MRSWFFHPLIFYPLVAIAAVGVVLISLRPQFWPRDPAPAAATLAESALVYDGDSFNSPADLPNRPVTVMRNFWGTPEALRVAIRVEPNAPEGEPTPDETGARILVTPEDAARINGRPATIEISYGPLAINTTQALAVSLQGAGPTVWVQQPTPPETNTVRFEVPAQTDVNAIGLRPVDPGVDRVYGLEITRIRVIPRA